MRLLRCAIRSKNLQLLQILLIASGQVVTKADLMRAAWSLSLLNSSPR
jgi:DNA-binding winged helix-turn-helix (wHTH) protein